MFYELENVDPILRFGDVIEGFQMLKPNYNNFPTDKLNFQISVENFKYFIVTTPCCSIEKSKLSVAALKEIRPAFLKNEYFAEDLTRINRLVSPENSVPKIAWEKFPEEEKQKRIGCGFSYTFLDIFVYDSNDLLENYELNSKEGKINCGYYMIDFKDIFVIESDQIQRNKKIPKILQLSIKSRDELRTKLATYFNRVPEEDVI
ncbi:hypothetical protein GM418_11040 [Maribellus comscasis]|uniref:Uncharacterized protein n=1 Tax=Maribellus comscasis TaxID=2681766 RepID=A0A6I6JMP1_9BACT|nr:hypothetical protein [Maribellus comscasis]QGY44175.1 hypothetical protein GM418_11040 [Maribellus comscasis]